MIRTKLDEDVYNVLKDYATSRNLTFKGVPSINRALKDLLMRGALKVK